MSDDPTANLAALVRRLVAGDIQTLVVCGPPRTGKSSILTEEFTLAKASVTRLHQGGREFFHKALYNASEKREILWLDDFDLSRRDGIIQMCMMASDRANNRLVTCHTKSRRKRRNDEDATPPPAFNFNGKLLIVGNYRLDEIKSRSFAAFLDKVMVFSFPWN